jgi:hypothetical protein
MVGGRGVGRGDVVEPIATFCGRSRGCPEVWVDHDAAEHRRVMITDDYGQPIRMSLIQLAELVTGCC